MRRRELIIALCNVALASPFAIQAAAQDKHLRRVGILTPHQMHEAWPTFFATLRGLGYEEGRTINLLTRSAEGNIDRLLDLGKELAAARPELILAVNTPGAAAAIAATKVIPIVIVDVGDPVGQGFVASLARPGGNVTGISNQATELAAKRLSLLKQAAPASRRIAVLFHPDDPVNEPQKLAIERHAPQLGVDINFFGVRSPADVSHAFGQLSSWRAEAVLWLIGQAATMQPRSIQLAAENRLPIMTVGRGSVRVGGFMSYYPDPHDVYRLAAHQIDRVLKGAQPADLPIQQPTKFELVINLKTAKALSLDVPPLLLAQADEVVE